VNVFARGSRTLALIANASHQRMTPSPLTIRAAA